jgi:Na+-translocating ferredoxin:NAD+ oxidoreductase RnfD subunit
MATVSTATSTPKPVHELADPRYLQLLLLGFFLLYGITWLGWHTHVYVYLAAVMSCVGTQYFWARRLHLPKGSWKSALISALGLSLLLKVNSWEYMALAGAVAISSKFLVTWRGKHIFNPTNVAIVLLVWVGVGWVSPGQWGSGEVVGLLVVLGATGVLFRVQRWDVALVFLATLFALEYARTVWYLGWPTDALWHKFQSGTLLLFAFFMITDPRTAPDHRLARVLWGAGVAVLSFVLSQFHHLYAAPIFALVAVSISTPILDTLWKERRFEWLSPNVKVFTSKQTNPIQMIQTRIAAWLVAMLMAAPQAFAFCGFYVSKAPATLFNHKSEVILVRDGKRTVITMSNDFKGDVREFAMVVPVPVVLREDQIRIADRGIFDRLDGYSAPRVVEYYDENPCAPPRHWYSEISMSRAPMNAPTMAMQGRMEKDTKVTIEARYTVGEYDVLLLSAAESQGLERWLKANGYRIPEGAAEILQPYVLSNTKFFVVKVNMDAHQLSGFEYLRPIQISFESEKFMLPIRLGMSNAQEAQDLVVYAFTRKGRVEPVNYRTVGVPTNREVPLFVQQSFGDFYKALFDRAYHREGRNAVFLEYAWNVSPDQGVKCDPCVSPPPVFDDFAEAGVNWVTGINPQSSVFFTRLHVCYTRDKFPQDLLFQLTPNVEHFQARYVTRHAAKGDLSCDAGREYREMLESRRRKEVDELYALTGWSDPAYKWYIHEYSPGVSHQGSRQGSFAPPVAGGDNGPDGGGIGGKWLMLGAMVSLILGLYLAQHRKLRAA